MGEIFRINEGDVPWAEFGDEPIRFKALTYQQPGVPSTQYIEYAPGHADPVHKHHTDEVMVVVAGELWLAGEETGNGPGSIVFVPKDTEYSVRGGDEGVRFFRIVTGS